MCGSKSIALQPDAPDRGQRVLLTAAQCTQIRQVYDGREFETVTGSLAAFLALLLTCDPAALAAVDSWTIWRCASEELQAHLRREGARITCSELGTTYPVRAA